MNKEKPKPQSKDSLGDRMKRYELTTEQYLMRRGYTIIRLDGKAFHTYTIGLKRPFDDGLMEDMDATAAFLCKNIQGTKCAFVQSDEITLVLTDFTELNTQAWMEYKIQKVTSLSAALATAEFNRLRIMRFLSDPKNLLNEMGATFVEIESLQKAMKKTAQFDSRVFQVPTRTEVKNCILWRQQDTTRNSISAVAQSLYSHTELHKVNTNQMQELCFQKGINWNNYASRYKRGRLIVKQQYAKGDTIRSKWAALEDIPIFSEDPTFLDTYIPDNV